MLPTMRKYILSYFLMFFSFHIATMSSPLSNKKKTVASKSHLFKATPYTFRERCPAHCDKKGNFYTPSRCPKSQFCCYKNDKLACCTDENRRVSKDVKNHFGCSLEPEKKTCLIPWWAHEYVAIAAFMMVLLMMTLCSIMTLCFFQTYNSKRRVLDLLNAQYVMKPPFLVPPVPSVGKNGEKIKEIVLQIAKQTPIEYIQITKAPNQWII